MCPRCTPVVSGSRSSAGQSHGRRVSRPVGRVLCARLRGAAVIHLGLPLPAASCGLPASIGRAALSRSRREPLAPLLTLLRVGFTEPPQSPAALVVSYTTVSPLPRLTPGRSIFCGTVPRVTPGRRCRPPCPVEPGPSSPGLRPARPPGRLTRAQDTPNAGRVDAVAARAHASKTTIYRRWRGKPELVKAAVDGYVAGRVPSWADTGSLRGDLMTVMRAMRGHLTDEFLAMMSGLTHAMHTDPELAGVLRSHLANDHSAALSIIRRAAERGEVTAGAQEALAGIAHEVIEAQLFRQISVGGSFDEEFARHVVDDLVLPALTHYREGET